MLAATPAHVAKQPMRTVRLHGQPWIVLRTYPSGQFVCGVWYSADGRFIEVCAPLPKSAPKA